MATNNPHTEFYIKTEGPDSEESIASLEALIGVRLPAEYRDHLLQHGGGFLEDKVMECIEPTPFGSHNITHIADVKSILRTLYIEIIPQNMICIGSGHLGIWTCLSVAGIDHGCIYSFDTEMRIFWDQQKIAAYPHLDPEIKRFFTQRDAGMLPSRPWGYDNCYKICDGFAEFFDNIRQQ